MLAPDTRAVLLDQLRPPAGFRLDAAVATSFTLDLAAALIPPLAFASFQIRGDADPVAALEAVRSCADRVDIFCQVGQISVPTQASDLMAFLEPMLHEVKASRPGHLFHPKIWFLRYVRDDEPAEYRMLCSSRNLTGDRSWDALVRLDGRIGTRRDAWNRPLVDLIKHLPDLCVRGLPAARQERVRQLAEETRRMEWDYPDDVSDLLFHTFGVPGSPAAPDFSGYKHLVVSPFCNDAGVERVLGERGTEVVLVSRPETLDALSPATLERVSPFILDPLAGLADPDDSEATDPSSSGPQGLLNGLHAKILVVERNKLGHVFIGSANATSAAYGGNVEFMVELVGGHSRLGVDRFLGADTGFGTILAPYRTGGGIAPDPADEERRLLENALRVLASRRYRLSIAPGSSDFDGRLTCDPAVSVPDGHRATAELLTRPGQAGVLPDGATADVPFTGIALADVTPFVVLRLTAPSGVSLATVIRAELLGDPPGRLDHVLARQVDTPEKFLRFLALLLGLADPSSLLALAGGAEETTGHFTFGGPSAGILELVLQALASRPDALLDLDRLVRRLGATEHGKNVMPAGFGALWSCVMTALSRRSEVLA